MHADKGFALTLGDGVSIGHQAMLHGCTIGDGSLIGIQSVVLNGAKIGKDCLIGACSLITAGMTVPDRSLVLGSPARIVRPLSDLEVEKLRQTTESYVQRCAIYRSGLKQVG